MSIPTWPSTLPQKLLIADYNQSFADTTIKSDMDAGPAKVRRRFTAGVEPVSGTLILTKDELGDLRAFYETTTLGGSLRFQWTKPPQHSDLCEMRFTSPPSWTAIGKRFKIALSLEILP